VLVYGLGQSATQATTGSLVVVGITSLAGAITAYRSGNALLTRGIVFGLVAIGGGAAGAKASGLVSQPVLLAARTPRKSPGRSPAGTPGAWTPSTAPAPARPSPSGTGNPR
jgi:hypothetical protein